MEGGNVWYTWLLEREQDAVDTAQGTEGPS